MNPITSIAEYKRRQRPNLDQQLGGYSGPTLKPKPPIAKVLPINKGN